MIFRQLFESQTCTYTYLLAEEPSRGRKAVLIDPVQGELEKYLQLLSELDLELVYALDTHVHADHVTALGDLRETTGCITIMGDQSQAACVSQTVTDGELITAGSLSIRALYTPGHTDDSYCFLVENMIFTGDTLLIRGTGRTDFQNGDAGHQYDSIFNKVLSLPDETVVYPGHDYKGWTSSTVAEERAHNPRLQVEDRAAYVKLMGSLNLPDPKQMDVAIPANLACGRPPVNAADKGFENIPPHAAHPRMPGWKVIDVREPDEYEDCHIDGADLIPLGNIARELGKLDPTTPTLLVCRSGRRSGEAAGMLCDAGFAEVYNLQGGMISWAGEELPTVGDNCPDSTTG